VEKFFLTGRSPHAKKDSLIDEKLLKKHGFEV